MEYVVFLVLLATMGRVSSKYDVGAIDKCVAVCDDCNAQFESSFAIRYCIQDCVWSRGTSLRKESLCNLPKYKDNTYDVLYNSHQEPGQRSGCHTICNNVQSGWRGESIE
uniref:Sucrase-isomaltase, intestinal n=1 Tax=Lygus hesperus TaxID=30085 RepID=A0A0A9XPI0_LYGHE